MNWAEITKRDPPSGGGPLKRIGGFLCRIGFHRPERAHEGRKADYMFCDRCGVRWVNDWGDPHRVSIRSREIAGAWKERAELPTLGAPPRGMAGSAVWTPPDRKVRVDIALPDGRVVSILADRAEDSELLDGLRRVMMDAKGIEQQGRAKDAPIPLVGLDRFQEEVRAYAAERFPEATLETTARHLFREAVELVIATQAETHGGFVFLADLQAALCSDIAREIDKAEARIPQAPMEGGDQPGGGGRWDAGARVRGVGGILPPDGDAREANDQPGARRGGTGCGGRPRTLEGGGGCVGGWRGIGFSIWTHR